MEIRKIQTTGGGTFVISLPKKWIEKYGLKKGDKFALIERENGIFVTPQFEEKKELKTEIEAKEGVSLEIITRYMYGYNYLQIKGNLNHKLRSEVKKTVDILIGYEIIDERQDEIVIQDLLDPSELRVKKAMKREYFLTSTMHKDAIKALITKDKRLAKDVILRDLEVDKLYYLVVRQLRTAILNTNFAEKVKVSPLECLDYRVVAKNIEDIGDAAERIGINCLEIEDAPKNILEKIEKFSKKSYCLHSDAIHALYSEDTKKALAVIEKKDKVQREKKILEEEIMQLDVKNAILLGNILDDLGLIAQKGIDIAYFVVKP